MPLTPKQKEAALETMRATGTYKASAAAIGVDVKTLRREIKDSSLFSRRIEEARIEGKQNVADRAVEMIQLIASGTLEKTDRNVLTANIALANAYEPGFRGTTHVEGRVDHDVRVITAVPRPKYEEIVEAKVKVLDMPKGRNE